MENVEKIENLVKIKKDWELKLKNVKNDDEKSIVIRRIKKLKDDIMLLSDNVVFDDTQSNCQSTQNQNQNQNLILETESDKVYYFSEKLQEKFFWDKSNQNVVFDSGPVYTEEEIRALHLNDNIDNIMLKCVHEIKRSFPQTKWLKTVDVIEQVSQEDELDLLFKDLKG